MLGPHNCNHHRATSAQVATIYYLLEAAWSTLARNKLPKLNTNHAHSCLLKNATAAAITTKDIHPHVLVPLTAAGGVATGAIGAPGGGATGGAATGVMGIPGILGAGAVPVIVAWSAPGGKRSA